MIKDISEFESDKKGLLAPNGRESNLSSELYEKVRTPEFLKWFGDWLNDPGSASKVVDENGEPLVCYHGTPAYGFSEFLNTYDLPRATANETNNLGFWFTSDKKVAEKFMFNSDRGGIYEVFLNLRNPRVFDKKILNIFEIGKLEDVSREIESKMRKMGWSVKDMTPDDRAKYYKLKKQSDKIHNQIRVLKSVDSFEQFMNHRDKYAEYIDGVKGEIGYWMRSLINTNKNEANKKLMGEFKNALYDGICILGTEYDAFMDNDHNNQYVVFDPENIKSVDNKIFNPQNTNIYESAGIYKKNGKFMNEAARFNVMIGDYDNADKIKQVFAEQLADKFDVESQPAIRSIASYLNDVMFDDRTFTVDLNSDAILNISKLLNSSEKDTAAAIEDLLNSHDFLLESDIKVNTHKIMNFHTFITEKLTLKESLDVNKRVSKSDIDRMMKIELEDFVSSFADLYGSAADVWMSMENWELLHDLFKKGDVEFKAVSGISTDGKNDPLVGKLLKSGWLKFEDEQNGDSYDAILYKPK